MDNKYLNGALARRGDIVSTKRGGLYVVIDPTCDDGSLFLATIAPPLGYTRKARAADCQIATPSLKERRIAAEVLSGFP
jgi:hypothetical protein